MKDKKVRRGRRPNRAKNPEAGSVPPAKGGSVADEAAGLPRPFDLRTVRYLVRLMNYYELTEIDLRDGNLRIRLQRGGGQMQAPPVLAAPAEANAAVPAAAAPAAPVVVPARPEPKLKEIKSPTPGTFYASPNPNAEPYVKVGSRVTPETVVCIIEAMKIFNEINADCTGVIAEICVENQQPVEFGQVLFRVDPTA